MSSPVSDSAQPPAQKGPISLPARSDSLRTNGHDTAGLAHRGAAEHRQLQLLHRRDAGQRDRMTNDLSGPSSVPRAIPSAFTARHIPAG